MPQRAQLVGPTLDPGPSGGFWTRRPMTDPYWYPMYEALVELDVPAMTDVSWSRNNTSTRFVRTTSTPTRRSSCS